MSKYTNAIGNHLSCGATCLKYLIFVFNFVFWIAGAVILGVGIWMKVDPRMLHFLQISNTANGSDLVTAAAIVLMVVGALMFVIGGLGCCGACKESVSLLSAYCSLLFFLIVLQVVAGILVVVFRSNILGSLHDDMKNTVTTRYNETSDGHKDAVTVAFDYMQVSFHCCGADSYTDWKNSSWVKTKPNNVTVPLTCCVLTNNDYKDPKPKDTVKCQRAARLANATGNPYIYAEGCYTKFNDFIIQYGGALIGVAFGFIVLQILGIILVCCLRSAIKSANEYEEI